MTWPGIFDHVTVDSFFLTHDCPRDFLLSRWSDIPLIYAIWSSVCSVYTVSMVIYSGVKNDSGVKIIIWLTHWTFYCVTLRFIITAGNCWFHIFTEKGSLRPNLSACLPAIRTQRRNVQEVVECHGSVDVNENSGTGKQNSVSDNCNLNICAEEKENYVVGLSVSRKDPFQPQELTGFLMCQWLFQNISNTVSILVTVLFWCVVYTGKQQDYISINSHVMNSLLVTADIMISRAPIRIQHFHIPLTYLTIYIVFTLIYWAAGGTNNKEQSYIYSVLDYSNHPKRAAVAICVIALVGVLLTQICVYFVCHLRNALYTWNRKGRFSVSRKNPEN